MSRSYEKHGLRSDPLYSTWDNLKRRCYNSGHKSYHRYGGRGITVCDEWRKSFSVFRDWCLANGWERGLQVDRRDNDLNYCPENCWIRTQKKNAQNGSRSKWWTVRGITYESIADAASANNVAESTIVAWCNGYTLKGKKYPAKTGCFSKAKYVTKSR